MMALHDPEIPENPGEQPLTLEFVASDLLDLREQFVKLQDTIIAMQCREIKRMDRELKRRRA